MITLQYNQSKSVRNIISDLLAQAIKQHQENPITPHVGTVLRYLVWAKLALTLPPDTAIHHGSTAAHNAPNSSDDFMIGDTAFYCTTAPTEALLQKCKASLQSGKRPIILTLAKTIEAAENLAETFGIDGRVEIIDALQFLVTNLYKLSQFKATQRKITMERLAKKYNEIVAKHESDPSLRITLG